MRVLLVEDEPDLGTAIKWALKQEKYVVDWAQDGHEAWEYLQQQWTHYTVGIFDWMLPDIMGVELCRRLRQRQNLLPVLILTAKDRLQDKVMGLDAGADDYLVKPFEMEELLARLRALQRRSPVLPRQQLQVGPICLNYTDRTVYCQQADGRLEPVSLTNKEFQLLEYFMSHPQQIVTKDQLLSQIWEMEVEVGSNVVAAQIRLLRRKLAEKGCSDFIETLPSMGYRVHSIYAK
ncbi:MAG: response regulator transcription factor [Synechococcales cyanobacterium C42_A2020_086]|jgi:DNA-binding response OmpR family regulator|nr:response regulator transcription factor [Synechococcales cyanobacterium C42_A2020_086]